MTFVHALRVSSDSLKYECKCKGELEPLQNERCLFS